MSIPLQFPLPETPLFPPDSHLPTNVYSFLRIQVRLDFLIFQLVPLLSAFLTLYAYPCVDLLYYTAFVDVLFCFYCQTTVSSLT